MRSNTALKIDHDDQIRLSAEIFDFNQLSDIQIAVEAEMACHLPGNINACDFEEFLSQYGNGVVSDFA